jgi:ubiquinone/menaquinone biosynthesis C-methylase UbiE
VAARLVGIDRETRWVEKAAERAGVAGLSNRFEYRIAAAEALPFDDAVFDLVTCQTLLMHVRDPGQVLTEMVRVTRPGRLVIAAEATNVAGPLADSIALGDSPDVTAAVMRFHLVCQRGLRLLGQGDHHVGESLPRLFAMGEIRAGGPRSIRRAAG